MDAEQIKELLKPRIKHIAPYPASTAYLKVGDILTYDSERKCYRGNNNIMMSKDTEKFTANFNILEWYEDRQESEMPEYLKFKNEPTVYKVEWEYYLGMHPKNVDNNLSLAWHFHRKDSLPATKEEFNNQKVKQ